MLVYVVLIALLGSAASTIFDCRNPGYTCLNGGTCQTDKTCNCASGFERFDCAVTTADKDANDCAATCLNGATCTDDTNGDSNVVCHCTEDYSGATCDTQLWSMTCTNAQMSVSASPSFTINGGAYDPALPACALTDTNNVFTKDLLFSGTSPCNVITPSTPVAGQSLWEQEILLQENAVYLTDADFVIVFSCLFDGEFTIESSIATITIDSTAGFGETTEEVEVGVVALSATPSASTQTVGTQIVFELTGNSNEIEKMRMETITIKGSSAAAVTIISSSCLVADMEAFVFIVPVITTNDQTLGTTLIVVKFSADSQIIWTFTVKTCLTAGVADCVAIVCTKRRRRSAEQDLVADNSTHTYNYKINVESIRNFGSKQDAGSQSECVNTDKMTAAVVAMAVACFVLLVICLVFIVRTLSTRRNVDGSKQNLYEDGLYQVPRMVVTKQ